MVMRGSANLFGQYIQEHKHLEVGRSEPLILSHRLSTDDAL